MVPIPVIHKLIASVGSHPLVVVFYLDRAFVVKKFHKPKGMFFIYFLVYFFGIIFPSKPFLFFSFCFVP